MKGVRYNRRQLSSAGPAAQRAAAETGHDWYIYATALGYKVDDKKPPFTQSYIVVHPDGKHEDVEHTPKITQVAKQIAALSLRPGEAGYHNSGPGWTVNGKDGVKLNLHDLTIAVRESHEYE